ncbi:MAG: TonB-dependent receptor [Acidobacteria bacterium]|nr:TonB-dependent receptor [Acidobacteriota bacterium]
MSCRNAVRNLLFAAIFALAIQSAHAVDTNGRIIGKVTDPTGALVPGAQITATNLLTGVKYTTVSQKDGGYFFAQLPIGTYSITATAHGFKAFQATGMQLKIDQEYNEPVQFTAGSENETVSVSADSIQVNTTDSQLNNVVQSDQMVELPDISRGFTQYELIEPGVQASSDRFGGFSADGGQTQQSSYLINGADANDLPLNTVGLNPNLDAIGQFNLVTGPLNAEYDRNSGGIVNATLKQGTNQFHGDAFEFYRDTFLNTGNYFANVAATPTTPQHKLVTPYHQNIFGGTIGGPILKDKLFFFGAYQGIRQSVPNNNQSALGTISPSSTVFTQGQLAGDFSSDINGSVLGYTFSTAPIPGTLNIPGCPGGTTWAACAASNGGVFPISTFNPISSSLVSKYMPAANQGSNSYVFNNVQTSSTNQYIGRVDFDPNPKNQFYFIWINEKLTELSTAPFTGATLPGFGEIDGHTDNQFTFDYVRQLSPTAVNDFAVHYTRFNDISVQPQNVVDPASLGFSIHPENVTAESVPLINTGDFALGFSNNGPQNRIDQTYQIDDSFSKTFGNHSLKFGYDGQRFNVSNPFSSNNNGTFGYAAGSAYGSGDPDLDFLLGNPSSYAQGTGATIQAYAFLNYFYAQDAWKVTNSLTVNYGLGYQIDTPLHNQQYGGEAITCFIPGQQSTVFPNAPVGVNYPGDPGCTNSAQAYTRYTDLGPRLGFAWAPDLGRLSAGNSGKFSIRGGFGIYYDRTEEESSLNNLNTPPFGLASQGAVDYGVAQATAFANPYQDIDSGMVYNNKFPYTFPTKGQTINYGVFEPLELNTYAKGFRSPSSDNFQISVEREFPSNVIARVSYVGALGRHNQIVYEGNPITQAGHDACLADTAQCGSPTTSGYRNQQSVRFPDHTAYGFVDPNTQRSAFASIGVVSSEGSSNYNSLQASVEKGASHGLAFQLSYTLAHSLDDGSSYEGVGYGGSNGRGYNQFDKALNYGNSSFDARQRIVFAPIYTVPSLSGHSALSPINLALSGWQVSGISSAATGFPFDISYGGGSSNSLWCSPSYYFYACPDEPNQTGPLVRANPRTFLAGTNRTQWFVAKSSGLSQAPLGQFGTLSRNKYHGPGSVNTNLILAKNFNIRADGSMRLQIRMESDNVFNHTNFLNPSSGVSSTTNGETLASPGTLSFGSAGDISTAGPARQTQLAAKFYF